MTLKSAAKCGPWVRYFTITAPNVIMIMVLGPVHTGHVCVPLHLGGLPRRVSDLPGDLAGHDNQRADERGQIQTLSERWEALFWFSGCKWVLFQSAEESTSHPLIEDCCRTQWTSLVSSLADLDRVKWTGPSSSQCRDHTRILRRIRSLSSMITSWSDLLMVN